MVTAEHQVLINQILHDIEQDDFILPTLPNIAVKIQQLIDDPNVSAEQVITVLSGDPFISAQIIKSANSAIFAGKPPVDNLRVATLRLGYRQLRNLVITITMNKLVASSNPILSDKLVQVWEHSRKVAAISYVLALRLPHLSADQAMLAGLMHDIGVIPLCIHIEKIRAPIDTEALETLINNCHATIGTKLLKQWNFSHEIVSVVAAHEDIHRTSNNAPLADYADVVTFANLQDSARAKIVVWDNVAAVKRIGLSEEECKMFLENNAERIEMVEILLGMKQRSKPAISSSPQRPPATVTPPPTAHPANEKSGLFSFFSRLRK